MLYPENEKPTLSEALFRHPGSEYRAAPFWAWNCKLEREELLRHLSRIRHVALKEAPGLKKVKIVYRLDALYAFSLAGNRQGQCGPFALPLYFFFLAAGYHD